MSIYPSGANSTASSSSRFPIPNPNPDYGPLARSPPPGGLAISPSAPDGPPVVTMGGSYESPRNLTEPRTRDIEGCSHGLVNGTNVVNHLSSGKEAYPGSSGQFGGKRISRPRSSLPHSPASGINTLHGNSSQSVSRKNQMVSANHLLNFHYDPIQRSQPRLPPPRKPQKTRPFNRDLFLQANYRFIVLDTGNYFVEAMDPDRMLDWDNIICVSYSTPTFVQCPICLESPLCPQITSCGHIFCFPCILRYLLMGEEDHRGECWKKCPLCFMMISSKDLYTISINYVKQYGVGDIVKFSLLCRPKNSFVPSRKNLDEGDSIPGSVDFSDSFSKFALTSDVELSVREAKSSLDEWLARADAGLVDDLERLPYVCAALEHLEQRMKGWAERQHVRSSSSSVDSKRNEQVMNISSQNATSSFKEHGFYSKLSKQPREMQPYAEGNEALEPDGIIIDNNEHGQGVLGSLPESAHRLSLQTSEDKTKKPFDGSKDVMDEDGYLFYQVTDGQHIILHPLNMKCLLYHYRSYDSLPSEVSGKILQLDTVTQSEATRRRFRFLSHFSLTTSFQLCEIDLSEMLPPDAFSPCIEEITRRQRQRKQLARKERQAKAQVGDVNVVSNPLPSYRQTFTSDASFSLDEFEALGNSVAPSTSPPVTGERKLFSDVTRLGFAAAYDSPSLRAEDPIPSSVEGPSIPTLSFASIISTTEPVEIPEPRLSGFGKKGKKSTKILLSTAGGRRY